MPLVIATSLSPEPIIAVIEPEVQHPLLMPIHLPAELRAAATARAVPPLRRSEWAKGAVLLTVLTP